MAMNVSENVSEFVWHRLNEWGIKRVFGYPGDGVGGLDVALEHGGNEVEYVQVRHEEMAAFMASAHAKFTGEPPAVLDGQPQAGAARVRPGDGAG